MRKSFTGIVCSFLMMSAAAIAQSDRGTITGTVSDPGGAVVASASIQANQLDTGAMFNATSTETGNYTLAQLPVGRYDIVVKVPGFKTFVRNGLVVQVAQTYRVDVTLEVGGTSESVTVTENASLLKTESGELSSNVTTQRLEDLPVLSIGAAASSAGLRNPYASMQLVPGAYWSANSAVRIAGSPGNTQSLRVEGQDSNNGFVTNSPNETQPSVDAVEEVAIQTSNYSAEYGQAGGGFLNVTMRSGTNQFHGSGYEYFVNEVFNAGQPFTNNGNGSLIRPVARRNDYGFTLGGPVWLPKIYNGHDKTFFFFNFEQYRETQSIVLPQTVPTAAYRAGNFTTALTGRALTTTDALGRPIQEGAIYDPATQRAVNGTVVRDQFPGNQIPMARLDPVALKAQSFIPQPNQAGVINNYLPPYLNPRVSDIPSVKIDQLLGSKSKLTGYWARTNTNSPNAPGFANGDGMPTPITGARGTFITTHTIRLNYDYTITPTLLLHLGAGMVHFFYSDDSPELTFNTAQQLGLQGTDGQGRFPYFTGLNSTNGTGGMINMGPGQQSHVFEEKPTFNASTTWVRGNHTYKLGAEAIFDGYPASVLAASNGSFAFSPNETSLPSLIGVNTGGAVVGFPYASFLLGQVDSGNISVPTDTRLGMHAFALFLQDSWKVSHRLTLDYGLRWDFQTYLGEEHGRMPNFSPNVLNPSAGNLPGGIIFEGSDPGRCNCKFGNNYPFAIGPRLGVAYQITPKTVFRAGFGVVYARTASNDFASMSIGSNNPFASPGLYQPAMTLSGGVPIKPVWPVFSAGLYPAYPGQAPTTPPFFIDQNAGRPPRQMQWSIGVQREIVKDFVVELNYVGNRGAWWQANQLVNPNALTPQILSAYGLSLNNPADLALLAKPISAQTRFASPYPGFPTSSTVAQALRPYPQFGTINENWAPLGKTWYDSLQLKATKRLSHGLDFTYSFAYQKELTLGAETEGTGNAPVQPSVNDVFNRSLNKYISGLSQPLSSIIAMNYTTQRWAKNKALSFVTRDWNFGVLVQYRSGLPIRAPNATNVLSTALFRGTFANRVAGQPLFNVDLNCHCYDPNSTFVLNPKAWTNPPDGQFSSSAAYYDDYRFQRRPIENLGFGRTFAIKERVTLSVRAEFTNIFNRAEVNNPVNGAAAGQAFNSTQTVKNGLNTGGFGWVNTATVFSTPRQGDVVVRVRF